MIIEHAKEIVADANKIAISLYGVAVEGIQYELSTRLSTTWGYATRDKLGRYLIKINSKVFEECGSNVDAFRNLIVHEFCHLLDHKLYKKWAHGHTWKMLMMNMGISPDRCVTKEEKKETGYAPVKRKMRMYSHSCTCRSHKVGGIIHNKILRGHTYRCNKCKAAIGADFIVVAP